MTRPPLSSRARPDSRPIGLDVGELLRITAVVRVGRLERLRDRPVDLDLAGPSSRIRAARADGLEACVLLSRRRDAVAVDGTERFEAEGDRAQVRVPAV